MKKIISLLLTVLMAFSALTVGTVSASAADEDIALEAGSVIFFDNTNTQWDKVYFYAWGFGFNGDTYEMNPVSGEENLYKIVVPKDVTAGTPYFLFKNTGTDDWSGQQTANLSAYAGYNTYKPLVDASGNVITVNLSYTERDPEPEVIMTPSSKNFVILLTCTIYAFNTDTARYTRGDNTYYFTGVTSFVTYSGGEVTVEADGATPLTCTYTRVNYANVTVDPKNYDGDIYMYTFGGDRVGQEFILMDKKDDGTYTARINGTAQVIFTTTNSWSTAKKFRIYENGEYLYEPLISAGESRTFDLYLE